MDRLKMFDKSEKILGIAACNQDAINLSVLMPTSVCKCENFDLLQGIAKKGTS